MRAVYLCPGTVVRICVFHREVHQVDIVLPLVVVSRFGEPIVSIIDPPMNNNGAPLLRSECGFINNTDETLTRGLQYGEMCDFLAYTDANLKIGASGDYNDGVADKMVDGMEVH